MSLVTPSDVASNAEALIRFQHDVAYLDRLHLFDAVALDDAELLRSRAGIQVIAWMWPDAFYGSDFDPFAAVANPDDDVRKRVRQTAARRFNRILDATAEAVGRSSDDVKKHLEWSTPLTALELDQLLRGRAPFPFAVIVRLCAALQLEFTKSWEVVNAPALAERIDQSALAHSLSRRLHTLTTDNLESLTKKLPRTHSGASHLEAAIYRAPAPNGRYASLYEALRADAREAPEYRLTELDRILIDAGEAPFPASARADRSWWAGTGTKTEGRPQVAAWWAAGYQIDQVVQDPESNEVTAIRFRALPGRAEWLADPRRATEREYRGPSAAPIPIYPFSASLIAKWNEPAAKARLVQALEVVATVAHSALPDDPDVLQLVRMLDKADEADRAEIEQYFSELRNEPVDPAWLTNILTRARRQGWARNEGSRTQPRWVAARPKALLIAEIADALALEAAEPGPGSTVPSRFLRKVASAVGLESADMTGPQAARAIIEASGRPWRPEYESRGGTVTAACLEAIRDAVHIKPDGTRTWVWRPEWDDPPSA